VTGQPNAELAWNVYDAINANPAHFDMDNWARAAANAPMIGLEQLTSPECGTTACFAGWAIVLSGYQITRDLEIVKANRVVPTTFSTLAASLLGLSDEQAEDLFYVDNEDFGPGLVAEIFGPRPVVPYGVEPVALDYDDVPPNAGSAS
jgi:hypothetical protein